MRAMQVDELMAEMGWVRRLARGLLRDGDAANDIAQDAWLVASEHAPEDGRPLRPWLHRVVTNLVRMRRRTETRRAARELGSGDERAVPSAEELLERVETQRVLAVEVTALREPYRSTLLLHYVEGLASAEIARRLGIPSATVRQRLKHGLDELRDRLRARTDGPKQGWLAALLPLAKVRPEPALALGALAMKKVIWIGALVLLLLLAGGVAWRVVRHRHGAPSDEAQFAGSRAVPPVLLTTTIDKRQVTLPSWLAQAGAPSRRVAGRVVFAKAPVANATVRIGVIASDPHVSVPAMTAAPPFVEVAKRVTNERGEFDFGLVPAASFVVSAEAKDKAAASLAVTVADPRTVTDHLVLVLGDCRTHVTGIVRDTVSPIARARLKTAGLAVTQSDDKGRFALCMPITQFPNIRVEADGYGTINVQVPAMTGEVHHDFVLVPEATIEGLVVDEAGTAVGRAVVRARPVLADSQDEASAVETVADDQGRFRIIGLAPTRYLLGAFAEHAQTHDQPMVVAAAGTTTRGVKLVLAKRVRLRGHVVMAGMPIAGAYVGIDHDGLARGPTTVAVSQADGSFTLDNAPLGPARLVAEPYSIVSPTALVVKGDLENLSIEVTAKAVLRGRVTRKGQAVTDAHVSLLPTVASATTDSDGRYVLEGLSAGNFNLFAANPQAFTNHSVTLAAGETQNVDLELESGGEVVGNVVDRAGNPVIGVVVRLVAGEDECRSLTDVNGAFDCATLAGHRDYHVSVFPGAGESAAYRPAAGGEFPLVHVEDGDTVVRDVRLAIDHEELAIRGKVIDDTGATVPDARVTKVGDANLWGDPMRTHADADGGFIIDGLAPGNYDLRARLPDGSVGEARQVPAGATGVTIKLARPGSIEGTLVGFTTTPGVIAAIGTWTEQDVVEAKVTGDQFSITGLKPASYTVQAVVDGVQLDGATVDVQSNVASKVTLHARPRATIQGRVLAFGTGRPVARMDCRVAVAMDARAGTWLGAGPAEQLTDSSGQFTLDAPSGRARVICDSGDASYSAAGANVDVRASGVTRIELTAVSIVSPLSNPGVGIDPGLIPPTVLRVRPASPLLPGDVIVAVDGFDVSNVIADAAMTLIRNHRAGTIATLSILRGGQPMTVQLTLQ